MDRRAVLAAFDEQIRRDPERGDVNGRAERDGAVIRRISLGDGWNGVTWSGLDAAGADAVIAAQITRFGELAGPWEWKYYSYDEPADLPARLLAAGFEAEPLETLLVAEIAELQIDVAPPAGVQLRAVADERDVAAMVSVHDAVFGPEHAAMNASLGATLLAGLAREPATAAGVIAFAGDTAVSAGRVEFHHGTDFASLWGGGTLADWRRRGLFRSLVARRAALAAAEGFRYLQVDASADSRPILERLGFVELATTTPFVHPGVAG